MRVFLLLLSFLFFSACGIPSGEFGWHALRNDDMDILEKELVVISEYTMTKQNLYFSPLDTIHYIYKFSRSPGRKKEFIITLEKKSLGYVEIELKKKHIETSTNYLKDKFSNLDAGKYRVNLVFDENIIDTV
ncbi:MAG: hypothetical protein AAF518_23060, partial [Spirochaetota bacterium]